MNAHALLTSQGWRGTGNSLHPTSNTIGLSRPLLVAKKKDQLGVGKKQHKTSDMWWMNAFDSSLKGLDTSKEGEVVQLSTSGGLDMVAKGGAKWVGSKGGLYSSFVRGEGLTGTMKMEEEEEKRKEEGGGKKRKRDDGEESKEEKRARKAAKSAAEAAAIIAERQSEDVAESLDTKETKEERRARKAAKKASREAKVIAMESASNGGVPDVESESREERREQRRSKKLGKVPKDEIALAEGEKDKTTDFTSTEDLIEPYAVKTESKEERKERRRLKKLAKVPKDEIAMAETEKAKKKSKRRKDE